MIGTRLMAETGAGGSGPPALFPFIARMLREEGVAAFYKVSQWIFPGLVPSTRSCTHFCLLLLYFSLFALDLQGLVLILYSTFCY